MGSRPTGYSTAMRLLVAAVASMAAVLVLAACGSSSTPTPEPPSPGPTATRIVAPPTPPVDEAPSPTTLAIDAAEMERVLGFLADYRRISGLWDASRDSYETWRAQPNGCGERDMEAALRGFVAGYESLASQVYDIRRPRTVQEAGELLAQAAQEEETGLRALRDNWQPGHDVAFSLYDQARVEANQLRRRADDAVEDLKSPLGGMPEATPTPEPEPFPGLEGPEAEFPGEGPGEGVPQEEPPPPDKEGLPAGLTEEEAEAIRMAELEGFQEEYAPIKELWDAFHRDYDGWRARDGDCNRNAVSDTLNSFLQEFGGIAQGVFLLPRAAVVRPPVELFAEAAEKHQLALRELRDEWRPYDESGFKTYERKRLEADRMRRQLTAAADDLALRYDISLEDL